RLLRFLNRSIAIKHNGNIGERTLIKALFTEVLAHHWKVYSLQSLLWGLLQSYGTRPINISLNSQNYSCGRVPHTIFAACFFSWLAMNFRFPISSESSIAIVINDH
ncbi:MAG: hypothetical protein U1B30_07060, partial [Pseudomonadota bacterium]|nr:hypothetical protein [Pseudomonadota bacterium]